MGLQPPQKEHLTGSETHDKLILEVAHISGHKQQIVLISNS